YTVCVKSVHYETEIIISKAWRKHLDVEVSTCTDHTPRGKALVDSSKEYDIVVLQEMWGGEVSAISALYLLTHEIPERNSLWSSSTIWGLGFLTSFVPSFVWNLVAPITLPLVDMLTAKQYSDQKNGGLFFANKKESCKTLWDYHHTFDFGPEPFGKS